MYNLKYGKELDESKLIGTFETIEKCLNIIGAEKSKAPYLRMWGGDILTVDYGMHNMFYYIINLDAVER